MGEYISMLALAFLGYFIIGCGSPATSKAEISLDIQPSKEATTDTAFQASSRIKFSVLNERLTTDLDLLGRIWGFLKYHHPAVASGKYNWDHELFRILPAYLNNQNPGQRDQLLVRWIESLGNVSPCSNCPAPASNSVHQPDHAWFKNSNINPKLQSQLQYLYQNRYQGKQHYIQMTPGGAFPQFLHEELYAHLPYPDAGYRLLTLFRYWNMIHYFFPHKHLINKNWNQTLPEYIPAFIQAKDELAYELITLQLIGEVQDTHANLWDGSNRIQEWKGPFYPPVHLRFIQDKLVVTDYYNPELKKEVGLAIGDVITHVNGEKIEDLEKRLKKYYPASNQAAQHRDMAVAILRSKDHEQTITFISDSGKPQTKKLKLYEKDKLNTYEWYPKSKEKCFKLLDNNIGYVTLQTIREQDVPAIKEAFKNTKGVIIDLRNYPAAFVLLSLGSYFVNADAASPVHSDGAKSSATPFAKISYGTTEHPGEFLMTPAISLPRGQDIYQGKVFVLVNEFTQSQAEYIALTLRAGSNTRILGSTTAGADGDVSSIWLPGGLKTTISGIGVYYPDGKETQRVGIVPDVEVKPTLAGIRQGKDEVLEKAMELINQSGK